MKKAVIRSIYPGVCAVVSALLFVILYVIIIDDIRGGYLEWEAAVFGITLIFPAVVCFIIARETYYDKISVIASAVYTTIGLIIVGYVCLVVIFYTAFVFDDTASDTSDPMYYSEKYKLVEEVHGIFPEEIPTNAENVIFDYAPPSWQGERHMLLKYEADEAYLNAVEETGEFRSLWEVGKADRKRLRIIMSSYFGVDCTPNDRALVDLITGDETGDSALLAVLILPETNGVSFIYYVD